MPRLLCIDYGRKRVGIAVTDPLKLIASPLTTVREHELMDFLQNYLAKEAVAGIVLGWPLDLKGQETEMTRAVEQLEKRMQKAFPALQCWRHDERFTSKMASASMVQAGFAKHTRRKKEEVDQRSAALILQSFLAQQEGGDSVMHE